MATLRTAVLLFRSIRTVFLKPMSWYQEYFFDLGHGQAAYWWHQTQGDVLISGQVFDWVNMGTNPPQLADRNQMLAYAVGVMEQNQGVDFSSFDSIVLYLALPTGVAADGGTGGVTSSGGRGHKGLVGTRGTAFDFWAHEFGHHLGLDHSYGAPSYKNAPWSGFGEYGHPHCVMSAQGYGGKGTPFYPAAPRDGLNEYAGLGPSVNAATAEGRNWIKAHHHNLAGGVGEYTIESRDVWRGPRPSVEQAVEIAGPGGRTHVVEYRRSLGWDQGLPSPSVIINDAQGSTADLAHPGTSSATYLGAIRLPITLGAPSLVFNGQGFGVEVLEWSAAQQTVRLRITPGRVRPRSFSTKQDRRLLRTEVLARGTHTFEPGKVLCLEGTWDWELVDPYQEWRFEVASPDPAQLQVEWTIDGVPAPDAMGSLLLVDKECSRNDADLVEAKSTRFVTTTYAVEPTLNGSVLRIQNNPAVGAFTGEVGYRYRTDIGLAEGAFDYDFEGRAYRYPPEFYERWERCLKAFKDANKPRQKYKLRPEIWERLNVDRRILVEDYLDALAAVREVHGTQAYRLALGMVSRSLGLPDLEPVAVSAAPLRIPVGRSAEVDDTPFGPQGARRQG